MPNISLKCKSHWIVKWVHRDKEYKHKDVAGDGLKNAVPHLKTWHSHLLSDPGKSLLHVSNTMPCIISPLFKSNSLNMSMVSSSKIVHQFLPSYPSSLLLLPTSKSQTMLHGGSSTALKIFQLKCTLAHSFVTKPHITCIKIRAGWRKDPLKRRMDACDVCWKCRYLSQAQAIHLHNSWLQCQPRESGAWGWQGQRCYLVRENLLCYRQMESTAVVLPGATWTSPWLQFLPLLFFLLGYFPVMTRHMMQNF